jgi:hypothetical protein
MMQHFVSHHLSCHPLAASVGLEPTTARLTAARSTIELQGISSLTDNVREWEKQESNLPLLLFRQALEPNQLFSQELINRHDLID